MKTPLALAGLVLGFLVLATTAGARSAATVAKPLKVRGGIGHLVAPGDRLNFAYTVYSGSNSVRGTLYVRNDRQRAFARLPLTRSNGYRTRIAARMIRGKQLLYYAVFRDPRSGRTLKLPAAGTRAPAVAWVLGKPVVIRLGTHRFGETRSAEAVVARARADEVGWDINEAEGFHLGPQTLQVGSDGSVWLEDSFNNRLLVWKPGHPEGFARSVPVPYGAGISDVAFGPAGTLYVTRTLRDPARVVLDRLNASSGQLLWENRIGLEYAGGPTGDSYPVIGSGSPLRLGPDGTLYYLVMTGLPGDEWGWMPVATPAGRPLAPRAQLSRIHFPFQPAGGGLRLLGPELYTPRDDTAPHEARYALVDRRGRLVRAWRVLSRSELNFHMTVPDLVGGDPVIALDFRPQGAGGGWEYEVLRLGPHRVVRFSLSRQVWGDLNVMPDLRVGRDGRLYQLASSPTAGVTISRYSFR